MEPKKVKEICGNCRLFDGDNKICKVAILYKGGKLNIPVDPEDLCFYQNKFIASPYPFQQEEFSVDVQQVKFWEDKGEVKIEYPEGFFGNDN